MNTTLRIRNTTNTQHPDDGSKEYRAGWKAYCNGEREKSVEWFAKAAAKGHAEGMYCLGDAYFYNDGVAKDCDKAIEWYIRAADNGYVSAMLFLGNIYKYGFGAAKNYDKAIEWYIRAANNGEKYSMWILGEMYEKGLGVAQDYAKAREWYVKTGDEMLIEKINQLIRNTKK